MRHAPTSTFNDSVTLAGIGAETRASRLAVLVAKLAWLAGLPRRVIAIRRDMALLGQMDGRELADIGLSRQDLWDAAALPPGQSPGMLFARRAAERRRAALAHRR